MRKGVRVSTWCFYTRYLLPATVYSSEPYLIRAHRAPLSLTVDGTQVCVQPTLYSRSQHWLLHTGVRLASQEACSALVEVLPADVAGALASLWQIVMNGDQLSTFCDILEEQVKLLRCLYTALP